jgi:ribosomal protein L34E
MSDYDRVHYHARKQKRPVCTRCRGTQRLQMALNPAAPVANLRFEPSNNCYYSIDFGDYITLCLKCHSRMDYRLRTSCTRFQRARRTAPRCTHCGQPMMVGQRGTHLSCAQLAGTGV